MPHVPLRQQVKEDNFSLAGTGESPKVQIKPRRWSTRRAPVAPCLVTDFIYHQVQVNPQHVAVHCEGSQPCTYRQLWDLVETISAAAEFPPKSIVPVCMDSSVDFVATLVAIMNCGAAYVVLDPTSSLERNRTIVADCGGKVVVDQKYTSMFDDCVSFEMLRAAEGSGARPARPDPADTAYLIYTSGSTGVPKGVMLSHGAATHGISNFNQHGHQRWLLFYNPVFSAAQRTILATLARGACLCLAPRDRLATALPEVLSNLQVDALGITPSALSLLEPDEMPSSLQQVTTVGEPLSQPTVDAWADKVKLRVSYGLSECAQLNFSRQLQVGDNPRNPGQPVDTTTVAIFEAGTTNEVSENEPGELCLYGPQIADGYHHREAETAASFVPNPFGPGVLFRTGDQAVRRTDGTIEILGRIDFQIKIHGQRVEPQEVAEKLACEDGIAGIVCVGAEVRGKKSLVAAIVPHESTNWPDLVSKSRDQARELFPPYMVPSYWLQYTSFPVNANGKIDLKAIRLEIESTDVDQLLGRDASHEHQTFSETASKIAEVWAEVLQHSSIYPSDTFVGLGGSSIDAIRTVRELRVRGIGIELADMLQSQTIQDIADQATEISQEATSVAPFSLLSDKELRNDFAADRNVADGFPLTALQEGVLVSTLQGNQHYLYQRVFDIRHLDTVRLRLAFELAFSRSDILRSTFVTATKGFAQVVRRDFSLPWHEVSQTLNEFLADDKERGVTLGEPFMRLTVLNGWILVVSVHHVLFDFWSHGFMFDDVAKLYRGFMPEQRVPWATFLGAVQKKPEGVEFWAQHLANATPTILNFMPVAESASSRRRLTVDLRVAATDLGVPSSAIFYAAWAMVLSVHTASLSVTMATAISGRELPLAGIEGIDGPTLALVPQAIDINPKASLQDLVRAVNANLWSIIQHSQYGIQGALAAADQRQATLFDTMVNVLVSGDRPQETQEVFHQLGRKPAWRTEYATLNIEESQGIVDISLTAPIPQGRLNYILHHFCTAVEAIIHTPQKTPAAINLLGQEEETFLLTLAERECVNATLHGQFEAMAARHTFRDALNFQNQLILTYSELDEQANQLAAFLSLSGVAAGDLVPLVLEKSPLMITAILAVLKLGAAYVPLSSENPVERNAFIIRDVEAKLVLVETSNAALFNGERFPLILLDQIQLSRFPSEKPDVTVTPDDLAYVLYTSGSTGTPKGVMVGHGSCASAMRSIIEFESRQDTRFKALQFSNYIFDVSLYDFFVTLHSGGTLCMAPQERLLGDLASVINEMEVDHCFLTPTVARLLDPEDVPSLKSMTVGGEQLTRDVVERWAPCVKLRNGYGPTEASVLVTMKDVTPSTCSGNIGRPLATVGTVILETDGDRPIPYGAIGELCFCGPQLAKGYFKRPDITKEVFYESEMGRAVYRSGDLARYLPDGDIECLGRKDDQVKVNGHRIELGEIEQAFLRTDEVTGCVLTLWKQENTTHLVAVVVFEPKDGELSTLSIEDFAENIERLKASLSGLAHYMFPKFVVPLSYIPKMPSGKANRKKIKALVNEMSQTDLSAYSFDKVGMDAAEKLPLETGNQKMLHQAWVDILGLPGDDFGREANFLSLGGDSIAAINLVSWLKRNDCSISVRDVLGNPVLEDMAQHVQQEDENNKAEAVTFVPPTELDGIIANAGIDVEYVYPCPPGQAEFLTQGARAEEYWCLMTIRSLGVDPDVDQWADLTRQLTATNDILRTTFTRCDGAWYGVVLPDTTPVVEYHDVADDDEQKPIADQIWNDRFEFGQPFIRYAIFRHADGTAKILTKLDHGLYDGTLLRIFDGHFRDYLADTSPESFTSFKEFAFHIWQINQQQPTLDFWKREDKQPIQFGFPAVQQPRINSFTVNTIHRDFDNFSRANGATISILFQTIFQIWLAKRSGRTDVAFDYLYTGRNVDLLDPQTINGTCANFLPMRSHIDPSTSAHDLIAQTQDEFWQYTENNTVGLEDIYRACEATREEHANKALFLFQPFEPAVPSSQEAYQKWVVMAESKITMPQPYAVVFEVIKTTDANGYKLKFSYDNSVWSKAEADREVELIETIINGVLENANIAIGEIET